MRNKKQKTFFLNTDKVKRVVGGAKEIPSFIRRTIHELLHNIFAGLEVTATSYALLLPKTRTSHPVSKLLRPYLQHKRLRALLGANLAGALVLATTVSASPGAIDTIEEGEMPIIVESEVVVRTAESGFQTPIETLGVSQRFHRFHKGVDLRAPIGTLIYPITDGRVTEVVMGRFGYGNYVVVDHGSHSSLYAHMGLVTVSVDNIVSKETQLGTVGLTGWTTGSHLHLEIYEEGKAIDPATVLNI